jgi:hypothetical protein
VPLAAQLREPDAGRRLAQAEPLGRARHALRAVDLVEQHEHPRVARHRSESGFHIRKFNARHRHHCMGEMLRQPWRR